MESKTTHVSRERTNLEVRALVYDKHFTCIRLAVEEKARGV